MRHRLMIFVLPVVCVLSSFYAHGEATPETVAWAIQIGGEGIDYPGAVEAFPDGSFIVTGRCNAPFYLSTPSEPVPYAAGEFVAKYNARRQLVWMRRFDTGLTDSLLVPWHYTDALPDGTFFMTGQFFEEITLGEGEANEAHFSLPDAEGIFLAAFNANGTLRWASFAHQGSSPGIGNGKLSASPDGTCYVAYSGGSSSVFAAGTPEEITATVTGRHLTSYSPAGALKWVKSDASSGGISNVLAMDNSCIGFDPLNYDATHYSSSGAPLWYGSCVTPFGPQRIPGRNSFIAIGSGSIATYDVATNGVVTRQWWLRELYEDDIVSRLGVYPDGSGLILLRSDPYFPIQCFSADGIAGTVWDSDLVFYYDQAGYHLGFMCPGPATPAFYAASCFDQTKTFGPGQPGETTLTPMGTEYDIFVALYGQEFGYFVDAYSVGRGRVDLVPHQPWYTPGTEVTALARPTFPNHDEFVEWQGDLSGNDPDAVITMDSDKSVTAVFVEIPGAPPLPAVSLAGLVILAAGFAATGLLQRGQK